MNRIIPLNLLAYPQAINHLLLRYALILTVGGLLCFLAPPVLAEVNKVPLIQAGKSPESQIYERVITHPGAKLLVSPGQIDAYSSAVRNFTPFYVYKEQRTDDGKVWLAVGKTAAGRMDGWLAQELTSPWKQALTLKFSKRTGREPVLFFQEESRLKEAMKSPNRYETARGLIDKAEEIKSGKAKEPGDWPLVAIEPIKTAVADRFYLLPIFAVDQPFKEGQLLQVASIDPGQPSSHELPKKDMRVGIVFVMDTTVSMGPYISRSREVVRKILQQAEQTGLADKIGYGLVAFRSSIEKTPALGYTVKKIADLHDGTNQKELESLLAQVDEAKVSSHAFDEDAFAGIKMAVNEMNWEPYSGRLIVLVTDAGAIKNDDKYSSTHMNEEQLAEIAKTKKINITTVHIKTAAGKKANNHDRAENQYTKLVNTASPLSTSSESPNIKGTYLSVPDGDQDEFSRNIDAFSKGLMQTVANAVSGKLNPSLDHPPATVDEVAQALGLAMQLEFFGNKAGAEAPKVRTAWVSDLDFASKDKVKRHAFDVCVLLTKNQLSALDKSLEMIMTNAVESRRDSSMDFFQKLASAAAQMSRDPVQFKPEQNLGALLPQYLLDLPYQSFIANLTSDTWKNMSDDEQRILLRNISGKRRLYKAYDEEVNNWEKFDSNNDGEAVFRVPLDDLP